MALTVIHNDPPADTEAQRAADRMNTRPLSDDRDGGTWFPAYSAAGNEAECEACRMLVHGPCVAAGGGAAALLVLCLPCAAKDCAQAEAAQVSK